uniref:Genetic suppressor element-like domain-containing protein n=1 Tax=Strigamia maritima TaxID=126957 RepID=T1J0M0_STRMM
MLDISHSSPTWRRSPGLFGSRNLSVYGESSNSPSSNAHHHHPVMLVHPRVHEGLPHGSKPPPLTMLPGSGHKSITRTTATVPPLSQVSPNNSIVTSMSNNPALNATRTSSFAAALRKLAKQATEPPDKDNSPVSPVSSPALSQRSTTPKRAPPPLILPGGQSISSPPVVTIAPTQTHLTLSDGRKSSERGHGHGLPLIEPLSIKRDLNSKGPHGLYMDKRDESALAKELSSSQFSHLRSHMSSSSRPEDVLLAARGFQPYRVADDMRHGIPPHVTFDHAGYPYHPMFLPPHLPQTFRLDDPLYLERYGMIRPPVLPLSSPSMLSHPGLPFLPSSRYPPELLGPPMGLISPSSAALNQERLKFEEEQRQRDREREREIERERERERDRERERLREREREIEREREQQEREKEREQQQRDRDAAYLALRNQEQHRMNIPIGRSLESPSGRFHKTDMPRDLARKSSGVASGASLSRPNSRSSSSVPNLGSFSAAALIGQASNTAASQRTSEEESWLQRQREHYYQQQQETVLDYRHPYFAARDLAQHERGEDLRNGERDQWNTKEGAVEYGRERSSSDPINVSSLSRNHHANEARDLTSMNKHHAVDGSSPAFAANHHHHHHHHYPGKYHNQSRLRPNSVQENSLNHSEARESEERLNSRLFEKKDQTNRIANERHHTPEAVVNNVAVNAVNARDSNSAPVVTSESTFAPAVTNGLENGSQQLVSKLDLEEHRLRMSRVNGTCRMESSESDDEENKAEKRRCQLLTIASGPPLKLDQSPKKLNFLGMFGLTTQQNKREIEFEKYVERRQRHHEPCISPLEEISQHSPRLPIPPGISPDDLLREPDYPQKVQFLKAFDLESVSKDRQREQDAIWQAVVEERLRRNGFFDPALQCLVAEKQNGGGREQATPENGKGLKRKKSDKHKSNKMMRQSSPLSSSSQDSLSLGVSVFQKSKQTVNSQLSSRQIQDGKKSSSGHLLVDNSQSIVNGNTHRQPHGHRHGERHVVLMTNSSELAKSKQIKDFAQEFHESVLQTTQQQQAMKLGQFGKGMRNLWEVNKPNDQRFERESYRWPGIEYLMESYERHLQEQKLEREVLLEQCQRLRLSNKDLNLSADKLSQKMADVVQGKRKLDEERQELQNTIDNLKRCLRGAR